MERTKYSSRREFLSRVSTASLLAGSGAAAISSPLSALASPEPRRKTRLGLDNFSIRAFGWKAPKLIEYAASQKVNTLLLSDLNVYESHEADYLGKIGAQAKAAGIELQAGTGSICPTSNSYKEKRWGKAEDHARLLIRTAKSLGANVARCYLGNRRDRDGDGGIYRHIEETVKVCKAVKSEAEDSGVKLAIENHAGDMQAWELVELIEAAGKSFVGATIDSGNATWTLEDPMVNLDLLGPYAVSAGIRDTMIWETDKGATAMWANVGQGLTDWKAYLARFQVVAPKAPFVLEIISYRWAGQMNYLEQDFWKRFPKARAHEFARYVALAKRGKPYTLPAGRPKEDEKAQQRFDLEQSLAYCREELGLGKA